MVGERYDCRDAEDKHRGYIERPATVPEYRARLPGRRIKLAIVKGGWRTEVERAESDRRFGRRSIATKT